MAITTTGGVRLKGNTCNVLFNEEGIGFVDSQSLSNGRYSWNVDWDQNDTDWLHDMLKQRMAWRNGEIEVPEWDQESAA